MSPSPALPPPVAQSQPPPAQNADTSPHALSESPLTFADAPIFFAAALFALGVLFGYYFWRAPAFLLAGMALAALVTLLAMGKAARVAVLPLAVLWLALGSLCLEIQPYPETQPELLQMADGLRRAVEGEVVRTGPLQPVKVQPLYSRKVLDEQTQQIDLKLHRAEWFTADSDGMIPVEGGLRASLYGPAGAPFPELHCGDQARLDLQMREPQRYLDPGVWNGAAYLQGEGVNVLGSVKVADVRVAAQRGRITFSCWLRHVQQTGSERLMNLAGAAPAWLPPFLRLDRADAAMLSAMVAGDRSYLDRPTRIGFERTGSFHLLVVSGLHLAIVAGLIFWLARLLRLPRVWASLLTIAVSLLYALLTGFGQPVQRSFWMVTLYLLGRLLYRQRSPMNAIGFAALCLLAADPRSLLDASFQMTLLSVLAIAGIAVPLAERTFAPYLRATRGLNLLAIDPTLPPRIAQFRVSLRMTAAALRPFAGRRLAWKGLPFLLRLLLMTFELLLVSAVVELAMTLPMAIYFHRITLLALPANFLIVPFVGILLPSALLTLATALASPAAAAAPGAVTAAMLHSVTWIIGSLGSLRAGDYRIPGPGGSAIAGFVLLLAFALWAVRRSRIWAVSACAALALAGGLSIWPRPIARTAGVLEVETIDVGQGDSLLLITPDGKTLLIDAGGFGGAPTAVHSRFDIGEDVVSPALWARGIRRLDAVAITHAHSDHIGGMPAVLANFRPREMWIGRNPHSAEYDALLKEAADLGVGIREHAAGEHFRFGEAEVAVLAPEPDYSPSAEPANDDSLALHVEYGKTSVLLEGDAEAPSEQRMLARGGLASSLLKIGHHGSRTSTTQAFLDAVKPEFAVISAGRHNSYGHPRIETLDELAAAHVRTYRTDTMGATSFYLNGTAVTAWPLMSPAR